MRPLTLLALTAGLSLCACAWPERAPRAVGLGNPQVGRVIMRREACGSCHDIPGDLLAVGKAGPPLAHVARRAVIAGVLPNTPDNLALWVRSPQELVPGNAMPDMGLSEGQARDVAAYLETLR